MGMNQKDFANLIVIGIVLAVVLGVGGYFVLVRKPAAPTQSQVKDDTADWKEYSWDNIIFKYPSDWNVTTEYHRTSVQEIAGEPAIIIGLHIEPPQPGDAYNRIEVGGRQFDCAIHGSTQTRCVTKGAAFHTQSNNPEILRVFDILMTTVRVEDETADWQTYRNDKYGFEVKYPPAWDLPYPGDGNDIHLASSPVGERGPKPGEVVVEIQAFHTKPSNIDLFSFAESQMAQPGDMGPRGELTKTNLYGLSVIKVEHAGGEGPDGPGYYIEKSSDKFFYILVYGRTYEQMVNRIISTIKFVK